MIKFEHEVATGEDHLDAGSLEVFSGEHDVDECHIRFAQVMFFVLNSSEVGARSLQHQNVIYAAKEARVGRIVYTSVLRAEISPLSVAEEHFDTEIRLKVCGVPFTILRNGWYTENYVASVPAAVQHGALFGSAAEGRISSAARVDYAEAAARVLTSSGHAGRTYELAGDSAYTLAGLAREISRQTGKEIPYKNLPRRQYAAFLQVMGLPADAANEYAGFDVAASHGALFDNAGQLSALIDRPTTPLSFVVAEVLERAAIAALPILLRRSNGNVA